MTDALSHKRYNNEEAVTQPVSRQILPTSSDRIQPCIDLNAAAYADVRNPSKFARSATLNSGNNFRQGAYQISIEGRGGGSAATSVTLRNDKSAPKPLVVFQFPKAHNPSSSIMFWLARGEECRIPSGFVGLINYSTAQTYTPVK
ncbi:hypothetical protein CBS101457_005066 [Exobasidium rhododendri]|nr:hypothetical protein CBS101457_005066 [Exobasidium rhododendri]